MAPPGSDTARFEVGSVEYVVKDELAHVDSTWTDVGDDGKPHTDEIIWALRLDAQGWRIAGMATKKSFRMNRRCCWISRSPKR